MNAHTTIGYYCSDLRLLRSVECLSMHICKLFDFSYACKRCNAKHKHAQAKQKSCIMLVRNHDVCTCVSFVIRTVLLVQVRYVNVLCVCFCACS
jgi:hypothetical protein